MQIGCNTNLRKFIEAGFTLLKDNPTFSLAVLLINGCEFIRLSSITKLFKICRNKFITFDTVTKTSLMFSVLFTLLGICTLTFFLKSILGISFNFVFILNSRQYVWIGILCTTGILCVLLFWVFNWSITVLQWSILLSFIWFLNKRPKGESGKEMYSNMGIKYGDVFYKIGAGLFLLSACATFVALYAETVK